MKRPGMVNAIGLALLLAAILSLPLIDRAEGATFCVDTPAVLQVALTAAASNGEGDVIQIVCGYRPS